MPASPRSFCLTGAGCLARQCTSVKRDWQSLSKEQNIVTMDASVIRRQSPEEQESERTAKRRSSKMMTRWMMTITTSGKMMTNEDCHDEAMLGSSRTLTKFLEVPVLQENLDV